MDSEPNLTELADEILGWLHERLAPANGQCDTTVHIQALVVCQMVQAQLTLGLPGEALLTGCEN